MSVPEPQPILSLPTEAAIFLVLTVSAGSEAGVADVLADAAGIKRSVGFRVPEAELTCVVGIGASLWDRLTRGPRPADLHPFRELVRVRATPRSRRRATCCSTSGRTGSTSASSSRSG